MTSFIQTDQSDYRPFLGLRHDYITALVGGKTMGKLETANTNQ